MFDAIVKILVFLYVVVLAFLYLFDVIKFENFAFAAILFVAISVLARDAVDAISEYLADRKK